MKKLIILTLLLTLVTISYSATAEWDYVKSEGRGGLSFGITTLDLKSVNDAIAPKYSTFNDQILTYGYTGYGKLNKFIIGGELNFLVPTEKDSGEDNKYNSSLYGGYGFLNIGMSFIDYGNINIYPIVGVGGGGVRIKLAKKGDVKFSEVVENPERSSELYAKSILLNAAIGIDYLFQLRSDVDGQGGINIGFRAGYIFAPIESKWVSDDINDVTDAPGFSMEGPYLKIVIGGGGRNFEK